MEILDHTYGAKKLNRIIYFIFLLFCTQVHAQEVLRDYKVLRVIDGDTVEIEAPYLPDELGKVLHLRVLGVDTPEKGHLAKCQKEDDLSREATHFTEHEIAKARKVQILLKKWDKFGGRVLGDILLDSKHWLSELLISKDYAVSYHGEKKTTDWCNKK